MATSTKVTQRPLLAFTVLLVALCSVHRLAFSCIEARSMAPNSLHGNSYVGLPAFKAGARDLANGVIATTSRSALAGAVAGALVGLTGISAVVAGANRQQARTAARVAPGAPSLIQVLEQKKLLSFVEKSGLLSKAENAGLGIDTVEKLGLLVLAEEKGLLSLAENVATSPDTPAKLLATSAALAGLVYLILSAPEVGFAQWVLAGAFGAPALVLFGAALVIFGLVGGTQRTKNLDQEDIVTTYSPAGGKFGEFKTERVKESVSLIQVLEKKNLLSFVEQNGLLTLAASLVNKPLTLTEKLGVLSTLESTGLLSAVESSATDKYGPAGFGAQGALFLTVAVLLAIFIPGTPGLIAAALAALPGLALLVVGLGLGVIQAPKKGTAGF